MIVNGDLLEADVDVILHQVNLNGEMGGGIAYQVATIYPNVLKEYQQFKTKELGEVWFVKTEKYVVGNCFSQEFNFDTNYQALEACLDKVVAYMKEKKLKTVGIPHKYGCGIANGNWYVVKKIFESKIPNIKIYKL